MAFLSPIGNDQIFDANGNPLVGGRIFTYLAGSSTLAATYTTQPGITPQANPIILNSLGLPANPVWMTGAIPLKFVIQDSVGVTLLTVDNVSGINDTTSSQSQWVELGLTPTFLSATSFSVIGDQTARLQVGRRLETQNTAGLRYSSITASAFSAGITTLTLVTDSGAIDSGLSIVRYGLLSSINRSVPAVGDLQGVTAINGSSISGARNMFVNGSRQVGQRGAPVSLSTTPTVGWPDNVAYWVSSGGVTGATIIQDANIAYQIAPFNFVSRTLTLLTISTLSGAGQVSARMRVPAEDAQKKNLKLLSFSCKVHHTKGSSVSYVIILRKPTTVDNYTSTTVIYTSPSISVPSGVGTTIGFSGIAAGDISNGVEVEVQALFGVTGLIYQYDTDWQLEESTFPTVFEQRPYADELRACQRYFRRFGGTTTYATGQANATTAAVVAINGISMFKNPTVALNAVNVNDASVASAATSATAVATGDAVALTVTTSGLTLGRGALLIGANAGSTLDLIAHLAV